VSDKDGVEATSAAQANRPGSPELTRLIGWLAAAAIAASIAKELETDPHDELEALLRDGSHPPPR